MTDPRARYLADSVATVGPQRLLTMLYDRLLVDLDHAVTAQRGGDPVGARRHLQHAQDIVAELVASLDVSAWDGGPRLLGLYSWLLRELVEASLAGDAARTDGCRAVVAPLRDAWHEASVALTPPTPVGALGVG